MEYPPTPGRWQEWLREMMRTVARRGLRMRPGYSAGGMRPRVHQVGAYCLRGSSRRGSRGVLTCSAYAASDVGLRV